MSKMIYTSPYREYEITNIDILRYRDNNKLALELVYYDEEYEQEEPFAMLTVNLVGYDLLEDNMAFVDTNNLPNAESFIAKYGFGEFTGVYGESGFVSNYPLYKFDLEKIKELNK